MYFLIGLAAFIAVLVVLAATRPNTSRYARSARMACAPQAAYDQVVDLHKWEAWSPWARLDPDMKVTYEGPESGPGAKYHWESKKGNVGAGNMTVMGAKAPTTIQVQVNFLKPFPGQGDITFTFATTDGGTEVTWAMVSKNTFMSKLFGLFMNMDKMIGRDFEKGLAAMKTVAEGRA